MGYVSKSRYDAPPKAPVIRQEGVYAPWKAGERRYTKTWPDGSVKYCWLIVDDYGLVSVTIEALEKIVKEAGFVEDDPKALA